MPHRQPEWALNSASRRTNSTPQWSHVSRTPTTVTDDGVEVEDEIGRAAAGVDVVDTEDDVDDDDRDDGLRTDDDGGSGRGDGRGGVWAPLFL